MNYMKEIAHMLGLEIGEEFKIDDIDARWSMVYSTSDVKPNIRR